MGRTWKVLAIVALAGIVGVWGILYWNKGENRGISWTVEWENANQILLSQEEGKLKTESKKAFSEQYGQLSEGIELNEWKSCPCLVPPASLDGPQLPLYNKTSQKIIDCWFSNPKDCSGEIRDYNDWEAMKEETKKKQEEEKKRKEEEARRKRQEEARKKREKEKKEQLRKEKNREECERVGIRAEHCSSDSGGLDKQKMIEGNTFDKEKYISLVNAIGNKPQTQTTIFSYKIQVVAKCCEQNEEWTCPGFYGTDPDFVNQIWGIRELEEGFFSSLDDDHKKDGIRWWYSFRNNRCKENFEPYVKIYAIPVKTKKSVWDPCVRYCKDDDGCNFGGKKLKKRTMFWFTNARAYRYRESHFWDNSWHRRLHPYFEYNIYYSIGKINEDFVCDLDWDMDDDSHGQTSYQKTIHAWEIPMDCNPNNEICKAPSVILPVF